MKQGIVITLIIAVIGVGYLFFSLQNKQQMNNSISSENLSEKFITMDELKKHATRDDCWTAVSGTVYNLTSFIALGQHPDQIVNACGTDGTQLFQTRGDKNSPHPQSASIKLETMIIGKLKK